MLLLSLGPRRNNALSLGPPTESEYKALADATAKLTRVQSLWSELGICLPKAPILWCDNIDATYLSLNPLFHARTKHVEIDFHFVCDKVAQKISLCNFYPPRIELRMFLLSLSRPPSLSSCDPS